MVGQCCSTGFTWDGKPVGSETKLASMDAYVTGDNKDRTILICPDIFGWKLNNTRLLADHFAQEANATVYLVDPFEGGAVKVEDMNNGKFDLNGFIAKNNKEKLYPAYEAVVKELKAKYKKIGIASYCYGGWTAAQLGGKGKNLVDVIHLAHPSLLTNELLDGIAVPALFIVPETDPIFTSELQAHAKEVLPKSGAAFKWIDFPGVAHGFATRGDPSNDTQRKALEKAKNDTVDWFNSQL
ncbi:Alpha/Beta hydrolase protein [Protomyces lactucae-debilis]|uniref:Alpha/Beta hydrolase protein n=1 Tax=Protomyces lactucae-debilis TaxID=2754530 RepID=A0A1Y2FWX6_PROLT|nr:Alpha/Beta hydrolase protein [Protomyces lactucae-debilis]ORY87804.1 Alpha/Beta hydrolase protein [Protomyces lactucae-debilis]